MRRTRRRRQQQQHTRRRRRHARAHAYTQGGVGQRGGFWDTLTSYWDDAKQKASSATAGWGSWFGTSSSTPDYSSFSSSSSYSSPPSSSSFSAAPTPTSSYTPSLTPSYAPPTSTPTTYGAFGGKRRRRRRHRSRRSRRRGGGTANSLSDSQLAANVAPVHGIRSAQPTYWETYGKIGGR